MKIDGFLLFVLVLATPFISCKAEDGSGGGDAAIDTSLGSDQSDGSFDVIDEEHVPMEPTNKRYHVSSVPDVLTLEPALATQIKPFLEAFVRPFAFSPVGEKFDAIIDKNNANAIDYVVYSMYAILKDELVKSKELFNNDQLEYKDKMKTPINGILTKTNDFVDKAYKLLNKNNESFKTTLNKVEDELDEVYADVKNIEQTYKNRMDDFGTQTRRVRDVHNEYATKLDRKCEAVKTLFNLKQATITRLTEDTAKKTRQAADHFNGRVRKVEEMAVRKNLSDFGETHNRVTFDDDDDLMNLSDFALADEDDV